MLTGRVRRERSLRETIAEIGPETAPSGTRALSLRELPDRTRVTTSSVRPTLPWNTTCRTLPSALPVSFSVLPPRARRPDAQRRMQVTVEIAGRAT
jgi:hypothetical protein